MASWRIRMRRAFRKRQELISRMMLQVDATGCGATICNYKPTNISFEAGWKLLETLEILVPPALAPVQFCLGTWICLERYLDKSYFFLGISRKVSWWLSAFGEFSGCKTMDWSILASKCLDDWNWRCNHADCQTSWRKSGSFEGPA